MSKIKKIILSGLLIALTIVLSRFLSIKTPIMKISFAFVPAMLCAIWLGVKWILVVNVLSDLIGALLFPTGPYFIGYTISTAVAAIIYGLILYKKDDKKYSDKQFILRLIVSSILITVIVNLGLNTIWASITSKSAVVAILPIRIVKELIMIPVKVSVIFLLEKITRKPIKKYLREEE